MYTGKKGLPPGSLIHVGPKYNEPSAFILNTFSSDTWIREKEYSTILKKFGKAKSEACWLEITGLSDIEPLIPVFEKLSLGSLLSEDILNTLQNSKAEFQSNLIFLILKNIAWNPSDLSWDSEQISLILKPDIFITFSEKESALMKPIYKAMDDPASKIRTHGHDFAFYAVTDLIVDGYLETCSHIDAYLDEIEINLDLQVSYDPTATLHLIKKFLVYFRHQVLPIREGITRIMKDSSDLISQDDYPYFQDILDHTNQVISLLDQIRENLNGLRELYMAQISLRTNKVVQLLTLISTIFIPLTFLAGVYGMNFHFMPELSWKYGYPLVLVLMVLIGIGFYLFYRRKKWL